MSTMEAVRMYVLSSSDAWPCCLLLTQDMQTPASAANAHQICPIPHLARLVPNMQEING